MLSFLNWGIVARPHAHANTKDDICLFLVPHIYCTLCLVDSSGMSCHMNILEEDYTVCRISVSNIYFFVFSNII